MRSIGQAFLRVRADRRRGGDIVLLLGEIAEFTTTLQGDTCLIEMPVAPDAVADLTTRLQSASFVQSVEVASIR